MAPSRRRCASTHASASSSRGWPRAKLALLRLTDAGALDPTFGTGGKVFGVNDGDETRGAKQVVFRNDGKINVIGSSFVPVG